MPVTIQHGGNGADYASLINLLAQEEQARRQRQQQVASQRLAEQAALQQAMQQAQAVQSPQQMAPANLPPTSRQLAAEAPAAPSTADLLRRELGLAEIGQRDRAAQMDAQAKRAAAFYAADQPFDNRAGIGALASITNNLIDQRGLGQRQSQALGAGLLREQMGIGQDQLMAGLESNLALTNDIFNAGPSAEVEEALASMAYDYTPEQNRRMDEIRSMLAKVDTAPNLTPSEKAAAKADLALEYQALINNPQFVPPNKRKVTPQQQFDQGTVERTNPNTGKKSSFFMGTRSGEPNPIPLDEDDNEAKAQLEQQKFDLKKQQDEAKAATDSYMNEMKLRADRTERILALNEKIFDAKMRKAEMTIAASMPDAEGKVSGYKPDLSEFDTIIAEAQRDVMALRSEMTPGEAISMGASMMPNFGAAVKQNRPALQTPPQDAATQQPVPVTNQQELAALPIGTKFILPDGRTGTRQ